MSYADRFQSAKAANAYDALYERDGHDVLVFAAQRAVVAGLVLRGSDQWHLDWACGTGRWLAALSECFAYQRGVDVSPAMLQLARKRAPEAHLVLSKDVVATAEHDGVMIATCFRFVLNADDDHREIALRAISQASGNRDAMLLVNNHGNAWSLRSLAWAYRRNDAEFKTLSHRHVVKLLAKTGWTVIDVRGFGLLPRRCHVGSSGRWIFRKEHQLFGRGKRALLCSDVTYVCVKKEPSTG